jgi:hypothetical protein
MFMTAVNNGLDIETIAALIGAALGFLGAIIGGVITSIVEKHLSKKTIEKNIRTDLYEKILTAIFTESSDSNLKKQLNILLPRLAVYDIDTYNIIMQFSNNGISRNELSNAIMGMVDKCTK